MLLNIPQESIDTAEEYNSGQFPIPKEGVGIPFEVKDIKTRENGDGSDDWEDIIIEMETEDDDGQVVTWGDYFYKPHEGFGLSKLKTFIQYLGLELTPEFDTDELVGICFTGDVMHQADKHNPAITRANIDYKTIQVEDGGGQKQGKPKPRKPARGGSRR